MLLSGSVNSPGATGGLGHTQLSRALLDPNLSLHALALLPTEDLSRTPFQ